MARIPVPQGPTLLAMSPDGSRLYAAGSGTLSIIDTGNLQVVGSVRTETNPTGIAVSADGKRVYTTYLFTNQLTVVDTVTNSQLTPITLIPNLTIGGYNRIALTRDGIRAFVGNGPNQQFATVDMVANDTSSFQLDMGPADLALTPDNRWLFIAGCKGFCVPGNVTVVDAQARRLVQTIAVGAKPYRVVVAPDGAKAYVANLGDPSVSIIDVATRSVVSTIPVPLQPTDLAISPDSKQVLVVGQTSGTLTLIDAVLSIARGTVQIGDSPREVVMSPDAHRLYVSTARQIVVINADQWPGK